MVMTEMPNLVSEEGRALVGEENAWPFFDYSLLWVISKKSVVR
jgi:hypothetical protein